MNDRVRNTVARVHPALMIFAALTILVLAVEAANAVTVQRGMTTASKLSNRGEAPSANNPPTVALAIPDTTVVQSSPPIDNYRDLNDVFDDAEDGSALAFLVLSNSHPGLLNAVIDADSALDLSFTPGLTGSATIVIAAVDSGGLFVLETFVVTVALVINIPPTVVAAIPDTTVDVNSPPISHYRDLNDVFDDEEDGAALNFVISSNSNPGLVTVVIDADSALALGFALFQSGDATIVVEATDSGGLSVADTFVVTVLPGSGAPMVVNAMPDTTVLVNSPPILKYRDLNSVFWDPEDGRNLLFGQLSNSNPGLVTATLDADSAINFEVAPDQSGVATIVVRAFDSGFLFVDDTLSITVEPTVCTVLPSTIDFGVINLGSHVDTTVTIVNTGGGVLNGTVGEACTHYSILSGDGAYSLAPGESLLVRVRYEPEVAGGPHLCTIETGDAICLDVLCSGSAQNPPTCAVSTDSLDFSVILPGETIDRSFTITNLGGGLLSGFVNLVDCEYYRLISGAGFYNLGSGDSLEFAVRFEPETEGVFICLIETGTDACSDVICSGIANETVPVAVQQYEANWVRDHVEVEWLLLDIDSPVDFSILRREGLGYDFMPLWDVDVVRSRNQFRFQDLTSEAGKSYGYRVEVVVGGEVATAFEATIETPSLEFALAQNHPNPFNPTTRIQFTIDQPGLVALSVFDVSGRLVRTLVSAELTPGTYTEEWDARDGRGSEVASGIYFFRLQMGSKLLTRKAVLLR